MTDDQHQNNATPATDELTALRQERDDYLAGWKRAQADYANLQKETEKSRQQFAKFATEDLLLRMTPIIDQFETALRYEPSLETVPETARPKFAAWSTGLKAVKALWDQMAKELGLEPVSADGPLDTLCHEAIAEEWHAAIPAGSIVRVVQRGWKLHGKLLRPATVIISKGPESTP
jgi:molecular chaperone GrpE